MAKKIKAIDPGASKAYLLSFGDTMTALCAFFIVLNSFAQEQTGANFRAGTGSFVNATQTMGMPGTLPGTYSGRTTPLNETAPLYIVPDPNGDEAAKGSNGPDDNDDDLRIIDRQREDFERFLRNFERISDVGSEESTAGEVVFDVFNTIKNTSPYLDDKSAEAFLQVLPQLRNPDYKVEIVVWATTPGTSAWTRAVSQSAGIREEVGKQANLTAEQKARLSAVGQAWMHSDVKRPIFSIIVKRMLPGSP